jgi:diguanylate cyclase (GGDEF)-like protein
MPIWNSAVPAARQCLRVLYLVALVLYLWAMRTGHLSPETVAEWARVVFGAVGLVAALGAARGEGLAWRARQAWLAVAVSFSVLVAAPPVLLLLDLADRDLADDVTHVAFVVALLVAFQLFPVAPATGRDRRKSTLDAVTVLAGGAMVVWYAAVGPYVEQHGVSAAGLFTAGLYPIADLALLFSVGRVVLRRAGGSARRPLRALATGALILFAGDVVHGHLHGGGNAEMHSPWQFICWITADAVLAAAALEQCLASRAAREPGGRTRSASSLQYAAVAVAPALMLVAAVREGELFPWGGLAVGGAVLSVLVLTRQALVQRESDEQAVTDGLTGLANRARFREASHRALERGERSGRYAAVLVLDMNGFKQVNDTLGHKSGDLVLVAFADVLRRCVPAGGLPARLGGDEFAVVLPGLVSPEQAHEVAGRIAAEMTPVVIDGKLIDMAASIGVAVSAPGELTHDEIVHRADVAMYRAKRHAPRTRWAGWRESYEQEEHGGHLPVAA